MFVFLVFSRAVCCVESQPKLKLKQSRVLCCTFRGWGCACYFPCSTSNSYNTLLHTSTYRSTHHDKQSNHHLQTITPQARASPLCATLFRCLLTQVASEQELVSETRTRECLAWYTVLTGLWEIRHGTVIRAFFHSRSFQALFASTVSFSFVHFASVRIDHGMRANERDNWNDGSSSSSSSSSCSGTLALPCTYSDKF